MWTTKRPVHAFTLVELLVVIAIISVLAAMLLPSLQAAMGEARLVSCVNQQKQISIGIQGYFMDFNDRLPNFRLPNQKPASYSSDYCWGGVMYTSWIGVPVGLGRLLAYGYLGPDGGYLPFNDWATPHASVNAFWRANSTIFRCPDMPVGPKVSGTTDVYLSNSLGAFAVADYAVPYYSQAAGVHRNTDRVSYYTTPIDVAYLTPTGWKTSAKTPPRFILSCYYSDSAGTNRVPHRRGKTWGDAPCLSVQGDVQVLPELFGGAVQQAFGTSHPNRGWVYVNASSDNCRGNGGTSWWAWAAKLAKDQ